MNSTKKMRVAGQGAYPIVVISLCAFFLFYKYVLQIYPSVVTEQLMTEFHLSGAGLGNLAATFYYTYTIMQLFVGVILDKYSTRWLTSLAILLCSVGVYMFAQTHSASSAGMWRALMGIGVAFATVAYMKLAAAWFLPRQYAFVAGLVASAAMAGAVFGQAPLAYAINIVGWRYCLAVTGVIGLIFAVVFAVVVRDKPQSTEEVHHNITTKDILKVFKNKQNWLLTLYGGLAFSPVVIFGGLWGNPFLQEAYQYSKTEGAFMVSLVFIGVGIGSPILGIISDKIGNRLNIMFFSTLIACIAISLVLYCHPMPKFLVGSMLFIFGFALGAYVLVFTIGKELNHAGLTATVIAMINASDPIFDSITEPGIGKLLDMTWDGKLVNGVPYFTLHNYHLALSVLPVYLALATLILLWVKPPKYD